MQPESSKISGPVGNRARGSLVIAMLLSCSLASAGFGQEHAVDTGYSPEDRPEPRVTSKSAAPGPEPRSAGSEMVDLEALKRTAGGLIRSGLRWYLRTPAVERMSWGGLIACAGLGLVVLLERAFRLRRSRIIPADFTARFLDRLYEGKLDGGKALDYCEMNPSPAARVALAAVRRWGRPAVDLERAVALTHRGEAERLRRNVGSLRRIAALAPLIGLVGSLLAVGRVLAAIPAPTTVVPAAQGVVVSTSVAWGPALGQASLP